MEIDILIYFLNSMFTNKVASKPRTSLMAPSSKGPYQIHMKFLEIHLGKCIHSAQQKLPGLTYPRQATSRTSFQGREDTQKICYLLFPIYKKKGKIVLKSLMNFCAPTISRHFFTSFNFEKIQRFQGREDTQKICYRNE